MKEIPFSMTGFWKPTCIKNESLNLSPCAERLRRYLARGLIGSCAGEVLHSQARGALTVYLCDRHAHQVITRAK